jgi:hypothetical protein
MFEKMEKQAMEARWEEEKLVRQTKTQPKLRHQHSSRGGGGAVWVARSTRRRHQLRLSLSVSLTGGVVPERADEVGGAPAPGTVCFDMVMYLTTVPKEMCIIANFTVR